MSNSSGNSGNFLSAILDFLLGLLGISKAPVTPTPPQPPAVPPDNTTEPVRIVTSHVLLVIYDPVMDPATGTKLSHFMNWNNPDDLINGFIQDTLDASGGNARFQIAQRVELNEFPAKTDGYRYDPQSFAAVMKGTQPPYKPEMVDYMAIITGLNILPQITRREIDEVWLIAFPNAGFYESTMAGAGAFWCNAPPLTATAGCDRKFVIMGFSYERGGGEMLHSFGHRCESIMTKAFEKTQGDANLYARFSRYDKTSPGQAGLGTIHLSIRARSRAQAAALASPRAHPSTRSSRRRASGTGASHRRSRSKAYGERARRRRAPRRAARAGSCPARRRATRRPPSPAAWRARRARRERGRG
jgi:hypothetical protein